MAGCRNGFGENGAGATDGPIDGPIDWGVVGILVADSGGELFTAAAVALLCDVDVNALGDRDIVCVALALLNSELAISASLVLVGLRMSLVNMCAAAIACDVISTGRRSGSFGDIRLDSVNADGSAMLGKLLDCIGLDNVAGCIANALRACRCAAVASASAALAPSSGGPSGPPKGGSGP